MSALVYLSKTLIYVLQSTHIICQKCDTFGTSKIVDNLIILDESDSLGPPIGHVVCN